MKAAPEPFREPSDVLARRATARRGARLSVATPGDVYEREANQAANRAMRGGESLALSALSPTAVGRRSETVSGRTEALVEHTLSERGRALDGGVRTQMERRLGHSFGNVRVHADASAAASAHALGAHAYTSGQHVVMGGAHSNQRTGRDRWLLAHELAHTVQQRGLEPYERTVQPFRGSLEGWEGDVWDESHFTANVQYKVFDTQGNLLHSELFTGRRHRPSYTLERNRGYVVQIVGTVTVFQDTTGPGGETNSWALRADWPVSVGSDGVVRLRPTELDVSGGRGDVPWSLGYGLVMGEGTVGMTFTLASTETRTDTYTGSFGISESAEVGGEAAAEPLGVGGAVSGAVGGGSSQEVSRGVEFGSGAALTEQFALLLDLNAAVQMDVGPVTAESAWTLPFDTGQDDYSTEQREELVRLFYSLDPEPPAFRQRGEGLTILVEGYASPLGGAEPNRALSQRRSEFVVAIARATLPGASIPDAGFLGEATWARDLPPNDNAQERRVATVRIIDRRDALRQTP